MALKGILGFCSFSATIFCKHCRLRKEETQQETLEVSSMVRNVENYNEDVSKLDEKETGIKRESIFNMIILFHVIHSAGVDIMHDISEGVLRYNMCAIILYFIRKKIFTLKTLNDRKKNFAYDYPDRGNISGNITMKKLRKGKLSMSASEMMTFVHNFGFIVGDLISPDDNVWKFYLKTIEVVDLVYLTCYSDSDLLQLQNSIKEMNEMYKTLFDKTLKPKHYFLTHYPRLTKKYGPLRYISCLRFKAKHREVKKYTKNTESRKNISFSIGRKLQYNFANILIKGDSLNDKLNYTGSRRAELLFQELFGNVGNVQNVSTINELDEIFEVDTLTFNGIFFTNNLFIPVISSSKEIILWKISKVLFIYRGDKQFAYLICQKYSKTIWDPHYASFKVSELYLEEIIELKNVNDLLTEHILPVSMRSFKGNEMFRLRNF